MSLEHSPAKGQDAQPRSVIRIREVQQITGLSRSTIWRKVKAGEFPVPVEIGKGMIGFYADEIAARQESLPRVSWAGQEQAA